jgi:DNA adenine methylase
MGRMIKRVPALPFVKWAGGKRSIIEHLIARTPKDIKTYYEPFLGGGALFFALASRKRIRFERAYLSDTNVRLMRTYAAITNRALHVIKHLRVHEARHGKRYYATTRAMACDRMNDAALASWFIYLNKTCFNGLYRVNSDNAFNVPIGSYKNPRICDAVNLMRCAAALSSNAYTGVRSFEYVERAKPGDFVYFDPPYYPLHAGSFTSYTTGFDAERLHIKLRDVALSLKKRGVRVLISNSDAPRVHDLYRDGFEMHPVMAARSVNSKAGARGKITDLLIT